MSTEADVMRCSVEDLFDHPRFAELCSEAAAECANRKLSAVAPDRAFYRTLEASGGAQFFRCGVGDELHGFASVLLAPSGANGKRYATVERLFVAKTHRAGGAGVRLMATVEEAARVAGCEAIVYSAHVRTALARLLFLHADLYEHTNHIFCRRLK